ncbi:MAG: polymorphic toxin type 5 domain-containing protein [Thermosynechococcaceae cyanobacterium]
MSFDVNANGGSEGTLELATLDSASLRDPFEPSQNVLADLNRGPQAMPGLPELSRLNLDAESHNKEGNQFETSLRSPLQPVLLEPVQAFVEKVFTEVPAVDAAVKTGAKLITHSSAVIEQTVESSKLLAKDTAVEIGGSIRGWVDTASERWNDPNNRAHNELNHQTETFVKGVQNLATNADNSEWMANVKTRLGAASEGFSAFVGKINGSLGYVDGSSATQEEAALAEAELRLKENFVVLRDNPDFLKTFKTAFGDDVDGSEATALVNDFVTGNREPGFKVVAAEALKGEGAFGDNTIFVSDQLLARAADNPETLDAVLLEEAGHYFDQKLNAVDSQGDEGEIFSRLAQGEAITDADLLRMKREDDHSTLVVNGQVISVENYIPDEGNSRSSSTPVVGSDRRLYIQAGTEDEFDAAFDAQRASSPVVSEPVAPARPPENPRQADRGQPEASTSTYSGMSADAAERWSQSAEESAPSGNSVSIGGSGDTLWAIAARHGVQWTDLRKPNGEAFTEEDARRLQIGDQVILPGQPTEEAVSAPPENPRQADLGQPEASASPHTGMTADTAEDWSQADEEIASVEQNESVIALPENPRQADLVSQSNDDATSGADEQLRNDVESLNEQIEALGTSSPSVTKTLQDELAPLEAELEKIEIEEQIDAIGTSSPSVTRALQEELSSVEAELEKSSVSTPENPRQADYILEEASAAVENKITGDQFDELNEKVQNWQGSDHDPIFDQLVRDRDAAFEDVSSGFDENFVADIEDYTREGELFADAYEKVLRERGDRINDATDEITQKLHTNSQSGWSRITPWTDGDREVTSEEAFAVFDILTGLNDDEAAAVVANLTEKQIEKLEVVLDEGQYTESTGGFHAVGAPFRVVGRAAWDAGDGLLDLPRAVVAWGEVYYEDATTIVPRQGVGDQNGYFGVHDEALAAGSDVLAEGNAPILSNLVRCQRGDNGSCWLLAVEVVAEVAGGPVAAKVSSVIGRAGSRLLVRFTTSEGDEVVTAISKETAEQVLRNTDGSAVDFDSFGAEFIDDGQRMIDQPFTPSPAAPSSPPINSPSSPIRRSSFRDRFMREQLRTIQADPNHPLQFLVDSGTGKWKSRVHNSPDIGVQAGHTVSGHSIQPGQLETLALEDAYGNQADNWVGERVGVIFEKPVIEINGVPVNKSSAQIWEASGLIPKGTVENAPVHPGYSAYTSQGLCLTHKS